MINNQCIFDYRHFYGFQVPWLHPACGLVEALAKSRWAEEQGRSCVQVPKNHLRMDVAPWCNTWMGWMGCDHQVGWDNDLHDAGTRIGR